MNIQFGKTETNQFFDWLAEKMMGLMFPRLEELIITKLDNEELLTRKEVCERILKCDVDTGDTYFLYAKGFPYVEFGKKGRRYPKKQVEKWIIENTKYN